MGIGVLGPLEVDGEAIALSPRDRVVLEALSLRPGAAVSTETLAEALWGTENRPASWAKVVQGCVVRLRKRLGPDRIETLPTGYRLGITRDELDHERFERLVLRAHELLTLGEQDRASYVAGEALDLWRGDPLVDLLEWDAGRIEIERLIELRRDAEEVRVEAELRSGHHAEMLVEARRLVTEAPLRESRWAMLALAQYQVGQQAEALRTLRKARTVLLNELGLDPGPDLVELEQAILRQDPVLSARTAIPPASETCPYPGLPAYDVRDADTFFGRESDVHAALRRLRDVGVLAILGPSGCGKSSLARAGIAAALQREGQRVVVVKPGPRPLSALSGAASRAAVLVVDQLEEALAPAVDADERARFFEELVDRGGRQLVVTMRADSLGELAAYPAFAHLAERGLYLLAAMSESDLRRAVEGPALHAGLRLEPGLVDLLVREVEGEPGALPLLSHALRQTWERREGQTLTVAGYLASGGIREAVSKSAEELYRRSDEAERAVLRDVVLRLVAQGPEGEATRAQASRRQVAGDQQHADLVEQLVSARLLSTDGDSVQIAHEALVRGWPRLRAWLDEDVEGHRIMRHLAVAAETWDAMGRPESELYRGARQARATEWRTRIDPDLNATERAFLDAGQELAEREQRATEEKVRYQRRVNRRLTSLLAAAAVLLAAALGAGGFAMREADRAATEAARAETEAVAAEARRLGAQALITPEIDTALLLAVEGALRDPSSDTRANLFSVLTRAPELVRAATNAPLVGLGVSQDGGLVAATSPVTGVTIYDAESLTEVGRYETTAAAAVFSPDGGHLAMSVGGSTPTGMKGRSRALRILDVDTWSEAAAQPGGQPGNHTVEFALDYDRDGDRLAAAFTNWETGRTTIAVWDMTRPARPLATFDIEGLAWVPGLSLSSDGESVVVGRVVRGAQSMTVQRYDVATGGLRGEAGPFHTTAQWPTLAMSPDDRAVAVPDGRSVVLLDLPSLEESGRVPGHGGGLPVSFALSPDRSRLAASKDDHTVVVRSTSGDEAVQELKAHSGPVVAVGFSADGDTLFSVSLDRRLLAWDLVGDRRLVPERHLPAPSDIRFQSRISPDGETVVHVDALRPELNLRFQDLRTGKLSRVLDTGLAPAANVDIVWSPDSRSIATWGSGGRVAVWDSETLEQTASRRVAGRSQGVFSLAFSPDGQHLVVGSEKDHLYILDENLALVRPPLRFGGGQGITAVSVSPDGRTVLAGSSRGNEGAVFHRLDLPSGRVEATDEFTWVPYAIAFSPDGERAAVTGEGGEVGLLDVESLDWVSLHPDGHKDAVWTARFSPDGSRFATSNPGLVNLWNGSTGRLEAALTPTTLDQTPDVLFRRGGGQLLITMLDGTTYRWDLRPRAWIDAACRIAGRNLDQDVEWPKYLPGQSYRETCPGQPGGEVAAAVR